MMKAISGRVLVVEGHPRYFVSHRLPWTCAARKAGYEIHVTALKAGDKALCGRRGLSTTTSRKETGAIVLQQNFVFCSSSIVCYVNWSPTSSTSSRFDPSSTGSGLLGWRACPLS